MSVPSEIKETGTLVSNHQNPTTKDLKQANDITEESLGVEEKLKEAWFKEFGLKSIDEYFIPKIPQEIQDKLAFEVKIKASDLEKIVEKGREKYIDKNKANF